MKRPLSILLAAILLWASCAAALGEGQLLTGRIDLSDPSGFGAMQTIDLNFTEWEDPSLLTDPVVRLYYYLYAADHLVPGISLGEWEAFLSEMHVYFLRRQAGTDADGEAYTDYAFLDTLALRLYGDPLERAELVASCPLHEGQTLTLAIETALSGEVIRQNRYLDPVLQYAADNLSAQPTQQEALPWPQDASTCLAQPHDAGDAALLPWLYMQYLRLLYAGMPYEQAEQLLAGHPVSGGSISKGEEWMLSGTDMSEAGVFGDAEYIQCAHALSAGSHVGIGLAFAQKRLCYATLVVSSPLCTDLCAYDLSLMRNVDREQLVPHLGEKLKRGVFVALPVPE